MQEIDTLAYAQQRDREDELQGFRSRFYFPHVGPGQAQPGSGGHGAGGQAPGEAIYFCGNSLGLQPRAAEDYIRQELEDWRTLAIDGYWQARTPWMTYPQTMRQTLGQLVGALEEEVTVMNALTVNLHLLLLTFYRPTGKRYKILVEAGAFPSDQYAVETQVKWHGFDPSAAIVEVGPRAGERLIRDEDILRLIDEHRGELALVLLGGLNYYTGQLFDIAGITAAAHSVGALAGFDLAHAVGNVELRLHDWRVDFAIWCSYKYLNGGPGAAGGAFIHQRFVEDPSLVRLGGWWGNDESSRFRMQKGFIPKPTAEGWSMSTAQVFNMVCLRASLDLFAEAGFERLRAKSRELTGYLYNLMGRLGTSGRSGTSGTSGTSDGSGTSGALGGSGTSGAGPEILTPVDPAWRGAQLSLFLGDRGKDIQQQLGKAGIVVDYREPGVVRVSPVPLYNSFEDVYRFYHILGELL